MLRITSPVSISPGNIRSEPDSRAILTCLGISAARIAIRELRGSRLRALGAVIVIAAGVAVMTSVRSVSVELQSSLLQQPRQWLAADVSMESAGADFAEAPIVPAGVQSTTVTETISMARSEAAANRLMVSIKAVDPRVYPFYGAVALEPSYALSAVLSPATAVVSRDAAERLHIHRGSEIRIGEAEFTIAAILVFEPDRIISSHNNYPRVIVTHEGLARAGILGAGARFSRRILFRLPPGVDAAAVRISLDGQFPWAEIEDYHDPDQRSAELIDVVVRFLRMAGAGSLLLGAAGAAIVMYLQVLRNVREIAVMKCLGAGRRRILAIRLWHTAILSCVGVAAGLAAGALIEKAFISVSLRYSPVPIAFHWSWQRASEDALVACAAVMLAAILPLRAAGAVRPLVLMRREADATSPPRFASRGKGAAAYGLRNLGRPGLYSKALGCAIAAIAACAVFTGTAGASLSRELMDSIPVPKSSLYFVGLNDDEIRSVGNLLARFDGVRGPLELLPIARIRLLKINGVPAGEHTFRTWVATCSDSVPKSEIVISTITAGRLGGISTGALLEFAGRQGTMRVRVARIREIDQLENFRYGLVLSCEDLRRTPVAYAAGVQVRPGQEDRVAGAIADAFPSLPLTSRKDVSAVVEAAVSRALWTIHLISMMTLVSGSVMVALVISMSREIRLRDIAILKVLGGRPASIQFAVCVEFGVLGLTAGLIGAVFGAGMSDALLSYELHKRVLSFHAAEILRDAICTSALCLAAAWLASRRSVSARPMEILRSTE